MYSLDTGCLECRMGADGAPFGSGLGASARHVSINGRGSDETECSRRWLDYDSRGKSARISSLSERFGTKAVPESSRYLRNS